MTQGPNVKKLIVRKMSFIAIPKGGEKSGLQSGIEFLSDPSRITAAAKEATAWVEDSIALIKSLPDNPYGNDDEVIAGKLLEKIEAKR